MLPESSEWKAAGRWKNEHCDYRADRKHRQQTDGTSAGGKRRSDLDCPRPAKLSEDVRRRVTVKQGDLSDAEFVAKATEGADALFWLNPPNFAAPDVSAYYEILRQSAVKAITANKIPRVVHISSGGGGSREAGLVTETFITEDALNATGANVISLRAGSFMENFLSYLFMLKNDGAWCSPFSPDLKAPFVATQDIAAVAARKLLHPDWQGQTFLAVHGAADLTPTEAMEILTETTGKTLKYVQVPAEAFRQNLLGFGASESVADQYIKMVAAFNTGIYAAEPRTSETTTPTTLAEWSRAVLKPALEA